MMKSLLKYTIMLAMLGHTLVGAQTTVTVPTPATPIAPSVSLSTNAVTALTQSTTNRVFIDQDGERPNVSVTQTGSGNSLGSDLSYSKNITNIPDRLSVGGVRNYTLQNAMYLRGDDHSIIIEQVGVNNTIGFRAVTPDIANQGISATIRQLGDSNFADVDCGTGTSTGGTVLTGCKAAQLNWLFTGDSNAIQFRGTGDNIDSQITVSGNSNEFVMDIIGNKNTQMFNVSGDFNVFNVLQSTNSTNGSTLWITLTGSSNQFNVSQTGTQDNVIKITSVGSGGTWNLVQRTTP
jgi:hypothetical protein